MGAEEGNRVCDAFSRRGRRAFPIEQESKETIGEVSRKSLRGLSGITYPVGFGRGIGREGEKACSADSECGVVMRSEIFSSMHGCFHELLGIAAPDHLDILLQTKLEFEVTLASALVSKNAPGPG